ncbi:hypothetical protein C8R43DRAFT_1113275 [Mycena crocata]|nr:hypothetical protein C8R43DRAFT_1113275 [Mycena crocata]
MTNLPLSVPNIRHVFRSRSPGQAEVPPEPRFLMHSMSGSRTCSTNIVYLRHDKGHDYRDHGPLPEVIADASPSSVEVEDTTYAIYKDGHVQMTWKDEKQKLQNIIIRSPTVDSVAEMTYTTADPVTGKKSTFTTTREMELEFGLLCVDSMYVNANNERTVRRVISVGITRDVLLRQLPGRYRSVSPTWNIEPVFAKVERKVQAYLIGFILSAYYTVGQGNPEDRIPCAALKLISLYGTALAPHGWTYSGLQGFSALSYIWSVARMVSKWVIEVAAFNGSTPSITPAFTIVHLSLRTPAILRNDEVCASWLYYFQLEFLPNI